MTEQPFSSDAPEFEYVRLLDFGTESDLVDIGTAYASTALPEWTPRAGNTEMVLMESLALMLGVEVLAVQQVPNMVVESLMGLYGITRDDGGESTGRVAFTVTDSNPTQIIPAGTRLRYYAAATGETLDVLTVEQVSIITSETLTGQVDVVAEIAGVSPNGTTVGTPLDVVDALLPFVESVEVVTAFAGGSGVESDDSYYGRAAAALARLTSTLVSPDSFTYAALSQPGVGRAKVFDLYNPADPNVTSPGHITLAVADMAGAALSVPDMDEMEQFLESQALASLAVHVIAPTYTTVNLSVTVRAEPGYTTADVQASVQSALAAWINPLSWDWSPAVTQYGLIAILASAAGVRAITTVPADIALAGKAPLPILGTVTVTVTA